MGTREWLYKNLSTCTTRYKGEDWALVFAFNYWLLWKWCNQTIFEDGFIDHVAPEAMVDQWVCDTKATTEVMT